MNQRYDDEEIPVDVGPGATDARSGDPRREGDPGREAGDGAGAGRGSGDAADAASDDRYLRLLAEFDNFRRRSHKDREQAVRQGIEKLAVPLFDVLDNLERALTHALATAPGPWVDGVALTARQLAEALRGAGIEAIDPLGEPFDPAWHEALGHTPSPVVPPDHVAAVVSSGYRLGDKLLRPARVLVSSGHAADE